VPAKARARPENSQSAWYAKFGGNLLVPTLPRLIGRPQAGKSVIHARQLPAPF